MLPKRMGLKWGQGVPHPLVPYLCTCPHPLDLHHSSSGSSSKGMEVAPMHGAGIVAGGSLLLLRGLDLLFLPPKPSAILATQNTSTRKKRR